MGKLPACRNWVASFVPLVAALALAGALTACSRTRTAAPTGVATEPTAGATPAVAIADATGTLLPATGRPTAAPTASLTPAPVVATVLADVLNVREGPGAGTESLDGVEQGEQLVVLGTNDDGTWLHVRTAGGLEGWVLAEMVALQPTATPVATLLGAPGPTTPAGPTPAAVIATLLVDVLNIRQGPGAGYPVVDRVEQGERLVVLGTNDDGTWLHVRTAGGLEGWVSAELVTIEAGGTATPQPAETLEPTETPPGLGVSHARVQSFYEELGFRFETSPDTKGQPQSLGTRPDGLVVVQLLGRPEDLVSASITVFPSDDEEVQGRNLQYLAWMATAVAPGWGEGVGWVYDRIEMARDQGPVQIIVEGMLLSLSAPGQLGALELAFTVP